MSAEYGEVVASVLHGRKTRLWSEQEPDYYKAEGFDILDVIQAFGLNFALGSAMKYIVRAGRKPTESRVNDLKKAKAFIEREIEQQLIFGD